MLQDGIKGVIIQRDMEAGAGMGLFVRGVKACPGTTCCKRGQQDSLAMGHLLDRKYHGMALPNKFKIGVKPRLSKELTLDLTNEQALALVDIIISHYRDHARGKERFGPEYPHAGEYNSKE